MYRIITFKAPIPFGSNPQSILENGSIIYSQSERRVFVIRRVIQGHEMMYSIPGFHEKQYADLYELEKDENYHRLDNLTILDNEHRLREWDGVK